MEVEPPENGGSTPEIARGPRPVGIHRQTPLHELYRDLQMFGRPRKIVEREQQLPKLCVRNVSGPEPLFGVSEGFLVLGIQFLKERPPDR